MKKPQSPFFGNLNLDISFRLIICRYSGVILWIIKEEKDQDLSPPTSFFSSFSTGEKHSYTKKHSQKSLLDFLAGILLFLNVEIPCV